MDAIDPSALKSWLDDAARTPPVVLDVREDWEVARCCLPGTVHIPMARIPEQAAQLDPGAETVVYCHHGGRSAQVGFYLERMGFKRVYNLTGGINAWSLQVDPGVPRY